MQLSSILILAPGNLHVDIIDLVQDRRHAFLGVIKNTGSFFGNHRCQHLLTPLLLGIVQLLNDIFGNFFDSRLYLRLFGDRAEGGFDLVFVDPAGGIGDQVQIIPVDNTAEFAAALFDPQHNAVVKLLFPGSQVGQLGLDPIVTGFDLV